MTRRTVLAAALAVLLVSAGCLVGLGTSEAPQTGAGGAMDATGTTTDAAGTPAASSVDCPDDRAYERRYGNLSRELARRVRSADADERIPVIVSVADVNRTAAKRAVERGDRTGAEYKEALSAEYERRAERRTEAVVAELRAIEGVTVEYVGSLRVRVRATPDAIRTIQALDRVRWLDRHEETTTYLS